MFNRLLLFFPFVSLVSYVLVPSDSLCVKKKVIDDLLKASILSITI